MEEKERKKKMEKKAKKAKQNQTPLSGTNTGAELTLSLGNSVAQKGCSS